MRRRVFEDDGSVDWSVIDTPAYKRRVAREQARSYAKYTPEEKAEFDRYVAMITYARAQAVYPAKGREEALLLVWWRDDASRSLSVAEGFAFYAHGRPVVVGVNRESGDEVYRASYPSVVSAEVAIASLAGRFPADRYFIESPA